MKSEKSRSGKTSADMLTHSQPYETPRPRKIVEKRTYNQQEKISSSNPTQPPKK